MELAFDLILSRPSAAALATPSTPPCQKGHEQGRHPGRKLLPSSYPNIWPLKAFPSSYPNIWPLKAFPSLREPRKLGVGGQSSDASSQLRIEMK